jgi:starch synthase
MTGNPRNILLITPEYPPETLGGLGTHVFELATGLDRMDCNIHIFTYTLQQFRVRRESNITVHSIAGNPPVETSASAPPEPSWVEEVLKVNKRFVEYGKEVLAQTEQRPEVIHCHDWLSFPGAHELREIFKCPLITTIHLLNHPLRDWLGLLPEPELFEQERRACLESDLVITVSNSMKTLIMETHGVPSERIRVVYNGMDFASADEFTEPEIQLTRKKYQLSRSQQVLFAGRLTPQKGVQVLLQSAVQVRRQFPNVQYVFAGAPDSYFAGQMVEGLLEEYKGLRRHVKFLGMIERRELALLYRTVNLAVVPSIYEPFGYAAIEALSAGVPVIASNVGGLGEIIEPGRTGLLVSVQPCENGRHEVNLEELIAAQLELLTDPARARQLGEQGRQYVRSTFTLEHMLEATLSAYRQASCQFQ